MPLIYNAQTDAFTYVAGGGGGGGGSGGHRIRTHMTYQETMDRMRNSEQFASHLAERDRIQDGLNEMSRRAIERLHVPPPVFPPPSPAMTDAIKAMKRLQHRAGIGKQTFIPFPDKELST